MDIPKSLANLINYANSVDQNGSERTFQLKAMVITPSEQIPLIIPTGFSRYSDFVNANSDDCRLDAHLQPGVYQDRVLPYKDNLYLELVIREGFRQTVYRYRCIPIHDSDAPMAGNNTSMADLSTKDNLNMVVIRLQLLDVGYSILRTIPVSDHLLLSTLDNAIHYELTKAGQTLNLTGGDAWKGVDIEYPYDNTRIFKQIIIPPGVTVPKLAEFFQNSEQFGFYSRGLGCYYRKGMWYIFPPMKTVSYDSAKKVLNVYRLPENVFPTLRNTWFQDDRVVTVLSTGASSNDDSNDIHKQNEGTGKRVVSSDAVMGETGRYYAKGQSMVTRADSLSEFKTSERGSGEEIIAYHPIPTSNLCKVLTDSSTTDGVTVIVPWHNSNSDLIRPGMPVRYYFMNGSNALMYREGRVQEIKTEYVKEIHNVDPVFREHSVMALFISKTAVAA